MKEIIKKVFSKLLKVKKSESILIICNRKQKDLAEEFLENGYGFGDHMLCIEIPEGKVSGEEPNAEVSSLFLDYDIILLLTSKSLSHTLATKNAIAKGARVISMPGITKEIIIRTLDIDYSKLQDLQTKIYNKMRKAGRIRIVTKAGTDISFKIHNEEISYKTSLDKKGDFHNLPMGEVFVAPLEGTAEGAYVVDGSQAGVGKIKENITIKVSKGYAVGISGGEEAAMLKKALDSVKNKDAYNIAELGIGTNPKARITGEILEDEKVIGTCHIALGSNHVFGGKVNAGIHLDGIIRKPTIYFDNKMIMKEGEFRI